MKNKKGFSLLKKTLLSGWDSLVCSWHSQTCNPRIPRFAAAHSSGFSLAEATITLAILGTIFAIIIPSIYSNHTQSVHRTKLKKAVEVYSNAVITMVEENNIKVRTDNNIAIDEWGLGEANDCANVREYFKIVDGNGCQFKTSDGIWWSFGGKDKNGDKIGSVTKALVAFKKDDLVKRKAIDETTNDAFFLMTLFDSKHKARSLDSAYSNYVGDSASIINTAKVYAFLNKNEMRDYYTICGECDDKEYECKSCMKNNCAKGHACDNNKNCEERTYCTLSYYNQNGILSGYRSSCNEKLTGCLAGEYPTKMLKNDGNTVTNFAGNCDTQASDCDYYVMKKTEYKDGDAPDFDSVDKKSYYSDFRKVEDSEKFRNCDFYSQDETDCKISSVPLYVYKIPNNGTYNGKNYNNIYMSVYYSGTGENKKIESIHVAYYPGQTPIGLIKYDNCSGWNIASCSCYSMNGDFPCPNKNN